MDSTPKKPSLSEMIQTSFSRTIQIINKSPNRASRECFDALKQLSFEISSLTSIPSGVPDELVQGLLQSLLAVITDNGIPFRMRFLSVFLMQKLATSNPNEQPQMLQSNLKHKGDNKIIMLLLPLINSLGCESAFETNLQNIVQWLAAQVPEFRSAIIPLLLLIAREYRYLMKSNHLSAIESQFSQYLSRASTMSDQKNSSQKSFWKNITTAPEPVTELDGTISREFFTILNNAQPYADDQLFNVFIFSGLYSWLKYIKFNTNNSTDNSNNNDSDAEDTIRSGSSINLTTTFEDIIVSYCLRVIEQSKLVSPTGTPQSLAKISIEDTVQETALIEALRILDALCQNDNNLVPKVFPNVKKILARNVKMNGVVHLTLLQYFVNHSDRVLYDPEPLCRHYFQDYLSKNYTNTLVAFETFRFCNDNMNKLLVSTSVFTMYFQPLLKLFAWFPRSFAKDFCRVLPALVSPSSFIELFHSLLDLPSIAASLERIEIEKSFRTEETYDVAESKYRVLYNHLLRNESGVSINFWESTMPMLQQFYTEVCVPPSPRVREICNRITELLSIYFDVLISYGTDQQIAELISVMIQRLEQLFPWEQYQVVVRRCLEQKLLAIFHKWPQFVVELKDLIIDVLGDSYSSARNELNLCLCWIVGEYASSKISAKISTEILNDYHEALELFAYERLSMVKLGISSSQNQFDSSSSTTEMSEEQKIYVTRLFLTLISSLAKIATKWQPLASRVVLCLAKILRHKEYFDPMIAQRANECISLLRYPSVASAMLDTPHRTGADWTPIDEDTSLSFLLQGSASTTDNNPYLFDQEGSQRSLLHVFLPS